MPLKKLERVYISRISTRLLLCHSGPVHLTLPGRNSSQNEKHLLKQAALGVLPLTPGRLQGTSTKRLLWPAAGRPTQQVVRLTRVETNVRSPRVRFSRTRTSGFTVGGGSRGDEGRGSRDPLSPAGTQVRRWYHPARVPVQEATGSRLRPGRWRTPRFCSAQASSGCVRPLSRGGRPSLHGPLAQMWLSSSNTLTDAPRSPSPGAASRADLQLAVSGPFARGSGVSCKPFPQ